MKSKAIAEMADRDLRRKGEQGDGARGANQQNSRLNNRKMRQLPPLFPLVLVSLSNELAFGRKTSSVAV